MERKKTILIAVFINAGLLVVLFVAALTMQDDTNMRMEMGDSLSQAAPTLKPLYVESEACSSNVASKQEEFPSLPLLQLPKTVASPVGSEEPVVHHLPPVAVEPTMPTPPIAQSHPLPSSSSYTEIVVKKGDSLEKIARGCNTTVNEIIQLNRLPSNFLKVGQVLKLPTEKTLQVSKPKAIPLEKVSSQPDYYTVKVGDNPWTIAMKHHMKVEELLRINHLNEEKARKLKPGDRLRIR